MSIARSCWDVRRGLRRILTFKYPREIREGQWRRRRQNDHAGISDGGGSGHRQAAAAAEALRSSVISCQECHLHRLQRPVACRGCLHGVNTCEFCLLLKGRLFLEHYYNDFWSFIVDSGKSFSYNFHYRTVTKKNQSFCVLPQRSNQRGTAAAQLCVAQRPAPRPRHGQTASFCLVLQ